MRKLHTVAHRVTTLAIAFGAMAYLSSNLFATIINTSGGAILNIANTPGTLVGVTSAPGCISWAGSTTCSGANPEPMSVSGSDAVVYQIPSTGTIKDLPASLTLPLTDFETVNGGTGGAGTVHFDLTGIVNPATQGFTPCVVPPASEPNPCSTGTFLFTQNSSTQVGISFTVNMEAYTGTSGTSPGLYDAATPFVGLFSTTISGTLDTGDASGSCVSQVATISNILSCESTGGTVKATWSAAESPSGTPEPASCALMGSGLIGLAFLLRRRTRRS